MLLRALVVLLVILNFGVATWWALRGAPGDAQALSPPGPWTLQLAHEAPPSAAPAAAADEAAASAPAVERETLRPASPAQCVAVGPFADAAERDAAQALIADRVVRTAPREVGETPRGWRVWMPPLADRAAADAMVARLLEAGFNDYYVIGDGTEANGIALGRFGGETGAQARAQALRAAGFTAEAAPLGSVLVRHWLDAMLAEGGSGDALRAAAGAARVESRDCNADWVAG